MTDVSDPELELAPSESARGKAFARLGRAALDPRWYVEHWVGLVSFLIVGACCGFVFWKLHPELLFLDTTPSGGDMGAHVWFPAFLRDHLLPWRLSGWSMDFYMGFAAGQFYFPLPALMIVALDVLLPYNVAFKLVAVAGAVFMPAGAYAALRGLRAPRPGPEMAAVATVFFLFFRGVAITPDDPLSATVLFHHQVMGGTIVSTLAGEFSFTIAFTLALCFIGALASALDRRMNPAVPAALLAATVLSHAVVGVFAAVAAVVVVSIRMARDARQPQGWVAGGGVIAAIVIALWFEDPLVFVAGAVFAAACAGWFLRTDRSRVLLLSLLVGAVGGLLTMVWSLPFVANVGWTTNMRYEKIETDLVSRYLFTDFQRPLQLLAVVAVVVAIARRRWATLAFAAIGLIAAIGFVRWPEGHIWNLRFLPFWYIALYLLAGLGVAELCRGLAWAARWFLGQGSSDQANAGPAMWIPDLRRWIVMGTAAVLTVAALIGVWRDDQPRTNAEGVAVGSYINYWAEYNFGGFEDRRESMVQKSPDEYRAVIDAVGELDPGTVLWEVARDANNNETIGNYGTPFALMLLPYWTDGAHPSLEGLYFEASATTPFVFLNQPRTSRDPAGTVRSLPYVAAMSDVTTGIAQARLLGVRYFMVQTPEMKTAADAEPSLTLVAEVPDVDGRDPLGWWIYEIADAGIVQPLAYQPVVVPVEGGLSSECFGRPPAGKDNELEPWLCVAGPWFEDALALDRLLVANGPKDWQHDSPDAARTADKVPLDPVEITDVRVEQDRVSFHVDETGVPVYIAVSAYPNWTVRGAEGPWRATPNGMVVVPTDHEVVLEFSRTRVEWIGFIGTLVGLVGLALLARWRWPYDPSVTDDPGDGLDPDGDDFDEDADDDVTDEIVEAEYGEDFGVDGQFEDWIETRRGGRFGRG